MSIRSEVSAGGLSGRILEQHSGAGLDGLGSPYDGACQRYDFCSGSVSGSQACTTDKVHNDRMAFRQSTHLFPAAKETPTHVTNHAAVALFALLAMVVAVCQIIVPARHGVERLGVAFEQRPGAVVLCVDVDVGSWW